MTPSLRDAQLRAVASRFLRARPRIVAPGSLIAMVVVYVAGIRGGQLWALLLVAGALNVLFVFENRRYKDIDVSRAAFFRSLLVTLAGLTVLCVLTGGVSSPLLPIWFAPTGILLAAFGGDPLVRRALVGVVLSVLAMTLVTLAELPLSTIRPPFSALLLTGTLMVSLALLYVGVGGLTAGYASLAEKLDSLRRQTVRDAEERSRALDSVGARVAHEIKNPLTAIKGLLQIEQRQLHDERGRRRLVVMASEVDRVEAILRDYLTFARPLSDLNPKSVDLRGLVDDVCQLVEGSAFDRGVFVRVEGSCAKTRADPNLIKQAVLNLTKNAIEATPRGGEVRLRVGRDADGPFVEVHDTGAGMDELALARVREAFFSERDGGTGLGVTLADTIAKQHRGTLSYQSAVRCGTCARLTIGELPGEGVVDGPAEARG